MKWRFEVISSELKSSDALEANEEFLSVLKLNNSSEFSNIYSLHKKIEESSRIDKLFFYKIKIELLFAC